jgi:hypothetical protein
LTFFFKQYGFSRMVVVISGAINLLLLPGWRLGVKAFLRGPARQRRSLFGRRTIIVGADRSGQEVLRKLRARIDDGYEIVGFIDTNRKRIGEKIAGVEILGSIDNIGKVVEEQKAAEVIFSTDVLSYSDILSVIGRSRNRSVNFRLIPTSLEVIIGKTHIDELDTIPLVDIDYNIDLATNRLAKRILDIMGSLVLIVIFAPLGALKRRSGREPSRFWEKVGQLPEVFRGDRSLVGPPEVTSLRNGTAAKSPYLGKPGLTGLVQINYRDDLTPEEIEKYNLYYAKNQSVMLDLEIIVKSVIILLKG